MRLQDKVILVTGSTTGIGEVIAATCVREGARVIVHGRDLEAGSRVVEQLGQDSVFIPGDLADPEVPARLVAGALEAFGRLDGLVNNAAWVPKSDLADTTTELWEQVHAINLRAPFLLIQAALEPLREAAGSVVNIGSINAWCGEPDLLAYSVSKGGLMTLSRNLGDSLHAEHGIRVNQVNPGWTLTPKEIEKKQEHGLDPDWHRKVPKLYAPSGGIMGPGPVAEATLYFLADESRPVSGSVVELEQFPVLGRNPAKDF